MLLKDYIMYWYTTYRMPKQAETTRQTYQSAIRTHIIPSAIGKKELHQLTARDLQIFLTEEFLHGKRTKLKHVDLTGQALSHHTVSKLRQILIAMFTQAVKEGLLQRNIAIDTEPVPIPYIDKPVFTPDMQRKFLLQCRNHRFYPAYVLLFYLGCRRSEILGLAWDSIDFRRNILTIRQSLVIVEGKPTLIQKTKTRSSHRTIPFPKEIKFLLQDWQKQQRQEAKTAGYKNENNLIFTNADGSPHHPNYFSRNFKAMVKKLDFCPNSLHLHSTRHSWATNMIQYGIAITDVQALGGWSRADTLLNIYAHTVKESQRKAIKKLYKELNTD